MNEQERNNFEVHPTVGRVFRVTGLALMLLAIYLTASMAFTFCLGLFAAGNRVVKLPGIGDPIVSLEAQREKRKPIDPSEMAEVARAEFAFCGNLIFDLPIVQTAWTGDGYDFHAVFQYLSPYLSEADLSAAALETTFAGFSNTFTGAPWYNSPDEIAPTLKAAGFDLMVTSTEHAYDSDVSGLQRTLDILRDAELTALGTVESADAPRYLIQTVGGIRLGIAAYTQAETGDDGSVTVNGLTADSVAAAGLNVFDPASISRFYTEIEGLLYSMRASGAEATVLYLHWGDDYSTIASADQRSMAQTLCDLGVDVILGSHPQVVQPVDLLTSTRDPNRKTLVLYSAGSLLSNLRADTTDVVSGHTEDGMLFRFALSKYNDDSVRVSAVEVIPTWKAVYGSGEQQDFCILPLDTQVSDWALAYDLNSTQLSAAKNSHSRTMAILTAGLNKISHALSEPLIPADPNAASSGLFEGVG